MEEMHKSINAQYEMRAWFPYLEACHWKMEDVHDVADDNDCDDDDDDDDYDKANNDYLMTKGYSQWIYSPINQKGDEKCSASCFTPYTTPSIHPSIIAAINQIDNAPKIELDKEVTWHKHPNKKHHLLLPTRSPSLIQVLTFSSEEQVLGTL